MCASAAEATATMGDIATGLSVAPRPTPDTVIGFCSDRPISEALKRVLFTDAELDASAKPTSGPTPGMKLKIPPESIANSFVGVDVGVKKLYGVAGEFRFDDAEEEDEDEDSEDAGDCISGESGSERYCAVDIRWCWW